MRTARHGIVLDENKEEETGNFARFANAVSCGTGALAGYPKEATARLHPRADHRKMKSMFLGKRLLFRLCIGFNLDEDLFGHTPPDSQA